MVLALTKYLADEMGEKYAVHIPIVASKIFAKLLEVVMVRVQCSSLRRARVIHNHLAREQKFADSVDAMPPDTSELARVIALLLNEDIRFVPVTALHAHGLRKAAAARLAELGALEKEIMAITGHRTSKEISRYTRGARQRILAGNAYAKHPRPNVTHSEAINPSGAQDESLNADLIDKNFGMVPRGGLCRRRASLSKINILELLDLASLYQPHVLSVTTCSLAQTAVGVTSPG